MCKKLTHLAGGAPRPIRKYRMTIAHRAAPLDPLDEPLSTTAVAAGTPAVGRWPSCRRLASCDKITGLHTFSIVLLHAILLGIEYLKSCTARMY